MKLVDDTNREMTEANRMAIEVRVIVMPVDCFSCPREGLREQRVWRRMRED